MQILIYQVWGGAQVSTFLMSYLSVTVLMVLAHRPHWLLRV